MTQRTAKKLQRLHSGGFPVVTLHLHTHVSQSFRFFEINLVFNSLRENNNGELVFVN